MPDNTNTNIIFYNTIVIVGKAGVKLYAQDGIVWMNQNRMALHLAGNFCLFCACNSK